MTIPNQPSQEQLQANRQPPAQLDYQALSLAQHYFDIRDHNTGVGGGPWTEALQSLAAVCNGLVTRAGRFDFVSPPQWVEHRPPVAWQPYGIRARAPSPPGPESGSTWTRESVQATPYQLEALDVAASMRNDLIKNHANDYKAIVAQALAGCAPQDVGVLTAQTEKVDSIKAEIQGVLNTVPSGLRNQRVQAVLNQALADNNVPLLFVLLSGPMNIFYLASGDINVQTLQGIYARATAKSNATTGHPNTPAIELVVLQDGDYALSNLVPAAVAYFDYEMSQTRAYLK